MIIEIKVPSPGESINEVQIASWLVENNSYVEQNQEIAELESDKATLAITAPSHGIINILKEEGSTVAVGATIATINTQAQKTEIKDQIETTQTPQKNIEIPVHSEIKTLISPLAKNIIRAENIAENEIISHKTNVRITKKDVLEYLEKKESSQQETTSDPNRTRRVKMSPLRLKLSERLVSVRQETAMLTTFNEINMSAVLEIKKQYNEPFKNKTGYSIGLVSFFAKACCIALKDFPAVNARIEGDEIVYHDFVDLNIAVSSPKGLITPIIRDADKKTLPEMEYIIKQYAEKANKNRISLSDLASGTFTITNGGVFGSLMSTPIINPPQAAILGMHKVQDRPVVDERKIIIAPMMFVALSYDHRLIDGRESAGFVVRVKEILENPHQTGLLSENEFDFFLTSVHEKNS